MRLLHRNIKVATEMIEARQYLDDGRLGNNAAPIIKASSMSYGGMTRSRQQVHQPHERPPRDNARKSYGGGHASNASIPTTSSLRKWSWHKSNKAIATNSLIDTMHEVSPNPSMASRTLNTDGQGQSRSVSRGELKQPPHPTF